MKTPIERLRELRIDHDLNQATVASVLGISQQHYSKYETGEHELPLRHFITLANYYHISADYLIGNCRYDEKPALKQLYLSKTYTCDDLLQDTLSLSDAGRQAVIEYVALQKLKESATL